MDHWEQNDKDRWSKEHDDGVIFREENWAKCAIIGKKVAQSYCDKFLVELKVPRPGKGSRGLELIVIPNKLLSYEQALLALKEVKAFVSGFKEAYQNLSS